MYVHAATCLSPHATMLLSRPAACHPKKASGTAICRTSGIAKLKDISLSSRRARRFGFDVLIDALDLQGAVLEHGRDRRDRCEDRRDNRADNPGGERKFCDCPAVVFDDHAPYIAFVND